jgi:hypothetical protein
VETLWNGTLNHSRRWRARPLGAERVRVMFPYRTHRLISSPLLRCLDLNRLIVIVSGQSLGSIPTLTARSEIVLVLVKTRSTGVALTLTPSRAARMGSSRIRNRMPGEWWEDSDLERGGEGRVTSRGRGYEHGLGHGHE